MLQVLMVLLTAQVESVMEFFMCLLCQEMSEWSLFEAERWRRWRRLCDDLRGRGQERGGRLLELAQGRVARRRRVLHRRRGGSHLTVLGSTSPLKRGRSKVGTTPISCVRLPHVLSLPEIGKDRFQLTYEKQIFCRLYLRYSCLMLTVTLGHLNLTECVTAAK